MAVKQILVMGFFLGFIFFLIFINQGESVFGKQTIESSPSKIVSDCAVKENNECIVYTTQSVIDIDNVIESNDSFVDQFLGTMGYLDSNYGIETVTLMIDPFGNTKTSPSILNIPAFSITANNQTIDLSSVKTSFFFITKQKLTSINVQGDVEFYLDDDLIDGGKKKFFLSGDSITNKTIPMYLGDSSFVPFSQRKDGFGFTFVDEIPKWTDRTNHDYRVVIKSLKGDISLETGEPKKIDWNGEFVAYDLKMYYDDSKLAVIKDSKLDLELKSDSVISSCGLGPQAVLGGAGLNTVYVSPTGAKSPDIEVFQGSASLGIIKGTVSDVAAVIDMNNQANNKPAGNSCNKLSLLRDMEYVFKIDGKSYSYLTKRTQENLFVQCRYDDIKIGDSGVYSHQYFFKGFGKKICESNFGYYDEKILIN